MSQPEIVFALYRPHEGKDAELLKLLETHIPTLRRIDLITDRDPILCRGEDGTYIEIFEWRDEDASAKAHESIELARLWKAMGEIADFPVLGSLTEIDKRFPHFSPVTL